MARGRRQYKFKIVVGINITTSGKSGCTVGLNSPGRIEGRAAFDSGYRNIGANRALTRGRIIERAGGRIDPIIKNETV